MLNKNVFIRIYLAEKLSFYIQWFLLSDTQSIVVKKFCRFEIFIEIFVLSIFESILTFSTIVSVCMYVCIPIRIPISK